MDQEKLKQMVDRLQQVIDTLLAVDPNINLDEAILTALRNAGITMSSKRMVGWLQCQP